MTDIFINDLKRLDWNNFWVSPLPQDLFVASIHHVLDKYCKAKQFNFAQEKKEWLTPNLIALIKDKDAAWKRFKRTGTQDDLNVSRYLKNYSKQQNKLAKEEYNTKEIDDNIHNPRAYWRAINKVVNPKPKTTTFSLIHDVTKIPVEQKDTANYINSYFANIGPKLAANLTEPWTYPSPSLNHNFKFSNITSEELLKIIYRLNIKKSSGVPLISTRVLRDAMIGLPEHITYIVNMVIDKSSFPDSWKKATVTPLPKGGDTSDVNNL